MNHYKMSDSKYIPTYISILLVLTTSVLFICSCSEPEEENLNKKVFSEATEAEETNQDTLDLKYSEIDPYKVFDSIRVDQAIDSIWFSTKVQKNNEAVQKHSKGERFLEVIPTISTEDEIIVQLSEFNGMNYVNHLTFFITPEEDWKIYYFDPIEAERVDFGRWNQE